ncbi:MAG: hypothetical protein LQ340_000332 [Diploschistes diacapsis]|nr:MAG: hypothetical protein LQ340_000332 [Diploschistes diacapsis]
MPSTTARNFSPISKPSHSPIQKKKMSLTQTYYLAHAARAKLSREAARADHDLRLLVGHANLLDGLMIDLVEAEREQESWFNQSVRGASAPEEANKHIRWADQPPTITEDYEEDADESEPESDDEEDVAATLASLRQAAALHSSANAMEMDEDDEEAIDDDEEDYSQLQLTRTASHTSSPPELLHESDSDSDEDSMPPSPPAPVEVSFASQTPQKPISQVEASFYEEGFYLPQRQIGVY